MKFAYGSIKKINEAIEAGTIPAETLIITSDNTDVAELFFYDKNKIICVNSDRGFRSETFSGETKPIYYTFTVDLSKIAFKKVSDS